MSYATEEIQIMKGIGSRVRLAREAKGYSRTEASKRSGISLFRYNGIEKGTRSMGVDEAVPVASALGMTWRYMLGFERDNLYGLLNSESQRDMRLRMGF